MRGRAHWRFARLFVLLALAVLLVSAMAITGFAAEADTAEKECYVSGDVNSDGELDPQDAIYALYSNLFGNEEYPINQDWDFNHDEKKNSKDAIELLYAAYGMSDEDLGVLTHDYHEPVWSWNAAGDVVSITVTFKCGCSDAVTVAYGQEGVDLAISELEDKRVAPGCLTTGAKVYQATITYDGKAYTSGEYAVAVAALGHDLGDWAACEDDADYHGKPCTGCGQYVSTEEHVWTESTVVTSDKPCSVANKQKYTCSKCGAEKTVELSLAEHTWVYVEGGDVLADNSKCQYVKQYKCSACNAMKSPEAADYYTNHSYAATSQVAATCQKDGYLVYTCTACNTQKAREDADTIPANENGHIWDAGVVSGNTTTYTCTEEGCGSIKTAVTAAEGGAVSKSDLENASEVALENATMDLSGVNKDSLTDEIKLNVTTKPVDEVITEVGGLAQEKQDEIKTDTVYNFTMTNSAGDNVDFEGQIVITLPYELQPNEDITDIGVWYISDTGALEYITATYADGYITFTVEHFSYYTVRRLTPAERCEQYGHLWTVSRKAATCTVDGYEKEVCQRCAAVQSEKVIAASGAHEYTVDETNSKAATCLVDGCTVSICGKCGHTATEVLKATGHSMVTVTLVEAKCGVDGSHTTGCENCDYEKTEGIPAKTHSYAYTETVAATCTAGGYDIHTCSLCVGTVQKNETAPKGHAYSVAENGWSWTDDYSSATVTLSCACGSTKELKANVSVKNASCTGSGAASATISYNNHTYTDERTTGDAPGHQPGTSWATTANQHYHLCAVCGEKVDIATHNFGEGTVTKEPTCVEPGSEVFACGVCGYEKTQTLSPTGEHDLVDGVCSVCGFAVAECDHKELYPSAMDISGYDICQGTELIWYSCGCGEVKRLEVNGEWACDFAEAGTREETTPEGVTYEVSIMQCSVCGMMAETAEYAVYTSDPCRAQYTSWAKLYLGDTVIAEFTYAYPDMYMDHPNSELLETVDLSEYGVCGIVLEVRGCPCGERVYTYEAENNCQWDYSEELGEYCTVCGVVRTGSYDMTMDEDTCTVTEVMSTVYLMDGKQIYSYTNTYYYENHRYELESYTLAGTDCEEGIHVKYVCAACGNVEEYDTHNHVMVHTEIIDLAGLGMCGGTLEQMSCPCEKNVRNYYQSGTTCQFQHSHWDEENMRDVYQCSVCGTQRYYQETRTEKDENCECMYIYSVTFVNSNGEVIATGINSGTTYSHNMIPSYTLQGESCEDGVLVNNTCADCGETGSYTIYNHEVSMVGQTDLAELGICGGTLYRYACACGQESWAETNIGCSSFNWIESGEDYELRQCDQCGVQWRSTTTVVEVIDTCRTRLLHTESYEKNGEVLVSYSNESTHTQHRWIYEMTLLEGATTCTEGYMVKHICLACGESGEYGPEYGEHPTLCTSREIISEGVLCGDLELKTYSCPCGENSHISYEWVNGSCDFQYIYDEDTGEEKEVCTLCGAERCVEVVRQRVEGTTCQYHQTTTDIFLLNGTEVARVERMGTYENHNDVAVYTLVGTTCDEGYYVTWKCSDCDFSYQEEGVQYGCSSRTVEREYIIRDNENVCGDVAWYVHACACGKDNWNSVFSSCRWEHMGWTEETGSQYQCVTCGLISYENNSWERIPGTCEGTETIDRTYILNGETIGTLNKQYNSKNHVYVMSGKLMGESCEDGYYLTDTCIYCGQGTTETELRYGHDIHRLACYWLEDYGLCGGEIGSYGCVCGQELRWQYSSNCDWTWTGEYDETTGMQLRKCGVCGINAYLGENTVYDAENCISGGYFYAKFWKDDGTVLLDLQERIVEESHYYLMVDYTLNVEGGSCEDGYTASLKCRYCDATSTTNGAYHSTWDVEIIDLAEQGACGGELRLWRCPCGQETGVHNNQECSDWNLIDSSTEVRDDGYTYYVNQWVCGNCGLKRIEESHNDIPEGSCHGTYYVSGQYWMNDTLLVSYSRENDTTSHASVETGAVLKEGSVTCEDGIIVTESCTRCGETWTWDTTDHRRYLAESLDLSQYGAVCGGTLDLYKCTCGEYQHYNSESLLCDLDETSVEPFVENVLEDIGQYTSDGWNHYRSFFWEYTCAVTDPQCGLTYRFARYWVQEGCEAVQYELLQLGYDEATGTWAQEIKIATGERRAYHSYTVTEVNETLEDGTVVTGERSACTCGSTYEDLYYYENGLEVRYEILAVNTLDNGESKQWQQTVERDFIHNGTAYITLDKAHWIYADGTEYWYSNTYEYLTAGTCGYTRYYSNSNGYTETYTYDHHDYSDRQEVTKEPTCSQPGIEQHQQFCDLCGLTTETTEYPLDPNGHDWYWDETLNTYVCNVCGLENSNGADGTIIIEDMTGDYGNGENYVVGYWNSGEGDFTVYVSAVLNEGTEEESEVVLENIPVTDLTAENDGVNAVSISEAAVNAAVEAAAVEGDYAIRITFVPADSDGTLDYAITFHAAAE